MLGLLIGEVDLYNHHTTLIATFTYHRPVTRPSLCGYVDEISMSDCVAPIHSPFRSEGDSWETHVAASIIKTCHALDCILSNATKCRANPPIALIIAPHALNCLVRCAGDRSCCEIISAPSSLYQSNTIHILKLTVNIPRTMMHNLLNHALILKILQRRSRKRAVNLQSVDEHGGGDEAVGLHVLL